MKEICGGFRGISIVAIGAILAATMFAAPAFADEGITPYDTTDHPVDFSLNLLTSSVFTNPEWKDDASSSYIYAQNMTTIEACRLQV